MSFQACGDCDQPIVKPSPLKVTLLSVDKADYKWGDKFVLEMLVRNGGDQPIVLPWMVDWRIAYSGRYKQSSLLDVVIVPKIESNRAQKQPPDADDWMRTTVLYGSTEEPGTL